uniref:Zan_2 protein n=1 Tax=Fopius arisanus TaxID=64838 RepID=A0A0C9RTM0_9HYME
METVVKVSRTVTSGVYRIFMNGARRVLAAIPLLGFYGDEVDDSADESRTGGEEAETSPAEEKSTPASPTEPLPAAAEDSEQATPAAATDDKNEASSTPAPTPTPLEAPKDDDKVEKKTEVSQVQAAIVEPMVEVTSKSQPIVTASIIERKTSEDFPSHLPSSPPPTPIDPSPLQQAHQSAAHANQLAEALKLPAVSLVQSQCESNDASQINDENVVKEQFNQSESHKSSIEDDKELVVMSEEGPVPVAPLQRVSTPPEEISAAVEIISAAPEEISVAQEEISVAPQVLPAPDEISAAPESPKEHLPEAEHNVEKIVPEVSEVPKVPEVPEVLEKSEIPEELLPEPEPNLIEEITIKEVTKVEESIPVEEVETKVIEETDVLVLPPAPPSDIEIVEDTEPKEEIPPPLPDSPIPVPKASSDLLNFMSSQISDTPPLSSIIDCSAVPQVADSLDNVTETQVPGPENDISSTDKDKPQAIDPQDIDDLPPPVDDNSGNKHEILTPPRSPSPSSLPPPKNESSNVNDNSINDVRTETVNNINSYHNNVVDKEDRLADSNGDKMQCPLNYADIVKKDQSIAEPEAPVEKINEVTTEKIEEAPKSLPPSVPIEVSVPAAPVITEDVASVTKAIEEIDINEKAVAAAVNETIESVNTNEIIADMNHQNTLNE